MKKIFFYTAIAASLLLTSCKDYTGKEKTHPLFVKAGTAKNAGEFQEAAKCYEDFLLICPKSSITHLELGKIYGDNLSEPLKAVYHYEKWLAMNPNDPNNAEDIRTFAEKARRDLFKKLCDTYKDDPALQQNAAELEALKKQLASYQQYNADLKNQNTQMKKILLQYRDVIQKVNTSRQPKDPQPQAKPAVSQPAGTAADAPAKVQNAASSAERTYKVQPGDTFWKISRNQYGSTKYAQLIMNANRAKLGKKMQLRAGQTIVLPAIPKK